MPGLELDWYATCNVYAAFAFLLFQIQHWICSSLATWRLNFVQFLKVSKTYLLLIWVEFCGFSWVVFGPSVRYISIQNDAPIFEYP
jgi:hypothetical protein